MSKNSTLIVHAGGVRRTREELATLSTPLPTASWKPVPHHELVSTLISGLQTHGVEVVREEYCTLGKEDAKVLGTLDLCIAGLDSPDFHMGLGLRAGNDKTCSVQFVAAARVFVCDNWAFSGSDGAVFLKRKHTARLDIRTVIPPAIEQFLGRAEAFRLDIDRMRNHFLTDAKAKALIYDAFAAGAMPLKLFGDVFRLYFCDEMQQAKFPDRSLWSLNNAMTEAIKTLRPVPQQTCGLEIGQMFGRLIHRKEPAPIAVIDGIEVFEA